MDKLSNSANKINELYKDLSYFDQYGGSVLIFIIITIILFIVYAYTKIMADVQPIKDDWTNQRCSPYVLPFAGLINKPDDMTTSDFTQDNFNYCMQNILISITGEAVKPLTYLVSALNTMYEDLREAFDHLRQMINNLRERVASIAQEIMGRILNIMTPLIQILIGFKDSMNKSQAILTAGLYTSLGTYYTLKSLMGAIGQFIIMILGTLAGMIIIMWLIMFTWPVAGSMSAIFISISVPLALILAFMVQVLHVQIDTSLPDLPPKPSCFDGNTKIKMNDNTYKSISEIQLGEKLYNNSTVTAILKLDAKDINIYDLDGIIVSGTHHVRHLDRWILVADHPNSIKISNYSESFIYCLNTESKNIIIENHVFSDWDQVYELELKQLSKSCNVKNFKMTDVHKYFDSGFVGTTNISLQNGEVREIQHLKVGDILQENICIYGIVEIDGSELFNQYIYNLGPMKKIKGVVTTLDKKYSKISMKKEEKLYHLLTNTGFFYIEDIHFDDYNSAVELYL